MKSHSIHCRTIDYGQRLTFRVPGDPVRLGGLPRELTGHETRSRRELLLYRVRPCAPHHSGRYTPDIPTFVSKVGECAPASQREPS
jgi:hypothetical protein